MMAASDAPRRICFVTYELHPTTWGGCGVLLHHAAEILLRRGHEITFLLDVPPKYVAQFRDVDRLNLPSPERCRAYGVDELCEDFPWAESELVSPGFIPTLNGIDGGYSELRRHGDFRMYHDAGGAVQESELILDSRLIGRSVWNSEWLLIIPGAGLHVDANTGLRQLAETVSDLKLHFKTYSHQGQ